MSFKEWREWYKELPWSFKWFVILILLRPIIDNFYKLKEVSPLFSPLYIIGILTPILILVSIYSKKLNRRHNSPIDNVFFCYGLLVAINALILDIYFPSISVIANSIKWMTPPLLFLYLRHVIRSERDLNGVLTAFLYSGIYLLIQMSYELIFSSIQNDHVTEGRGGGERLLGFYNDMMNYAVYVVGTMLIGGYFFLKDVYSGRKSKIGSLKFPLTLVIVFAGLIAIKHVSTWAVCISLLGLIILYNFRNLRGFIIVMFIVSIGVTFFAQTIYDKQIKPLINKEVDVAHGDALIEGGLNGRVGRWEKYFDIWIDEIPLYSKLFGIANTGNRNSIMMTGGGMHNDFVRNLFMVGIVGLLLYFIFLVMVFFRSRYFRIPEKFLIVGALLALSLHSISTLPLAYSSYIYLLLSVFSFSSLPLNKAYPNSSKGNIIRKKSSSLFVEKGLHYPGS